MSQEDFNPIRFRHHLHHYPELSLNEYKTASEITNQLLKFGLAPKTNIGGHGIIVEIVGEKSGPTTLFVPTLMHFLLMRSPIIAMVLTIVVVCMLVGTMVI